MPQIKTQDLYRSFITEANGIAASGDVDFTVSTAPKYTNGFLVLSPENAASRETVYFHNAIGNRIYVRGVNRKSPKFHPVSDSVQMNDVEEIFNFYSDMTSPLFYVEKTGGLNVRVWGGTVLVNRTQVTVSDTNLTLTDNTTNYIVYDYVANAVSVNTTGAGLVKATVVVVSGLITSVVQNTIKESYADPFVPDTSLVATVIQNNAFAYADSTGSSNAYLVSYTPVPTAYVAGQKFFFKANFQNTGSATLNVNGLGAKTIKKLDGATDLVATDIASGAMVEVMYDGTNFQLTSIPQTIKNNDITQLTSVTNLPLKSTPVGADTILIGDSEAGGMNKEVSVSSLIGEYNEKIFTSGSAISSGEVVTLLSNGQATKLLNETDIFIGFAKNTVSNGQQVTVAILGVASGYTGLTPASKYYIRGSNTYDSRQVVPFNSSGNVPSAVVNGRIYLINGTSSHQEYDPVANTWASKANPSVPGLLAASIGNIIYLVGASTLHSYNTTTNSWTTGLSAPLFSANNTGPGIIGTINGKLYVVEGRDNTSNRVQEYDPVANTWTLRAAQSIDPVYNCGSAIINSKLYQFGGTRASGSVVPSTYEYDPVVNTWVTRSNMPAERNGSSASNSGNLGYVFGGRDNFGVYQNTMYEYNATTNTWATRLSGATASRAPSVNAVGKSVFIMGGELSGPNSSNQHSRYNSDTFLTTAVTGLSIGTAVSASEIFIKNTL